MAELLSFVWLNELILMSDSFSWLLVAKFWLFCLYKFNGSQLAKMKKSIPDMSLP